MINKKMFMALLMMGAGSSVVMAQSTEQEKEVKYKKSYFELGYSATSFDEAKASGGYGISWTSLPWKLAGGLYLGFNLSPFNFNFGLVDSDYTTDVIKFGPALGFHFSKGFMVAVPVDVTCAVGFGDETSTAWGMQIAPALYFGKSGGVYLGPQFSFGFAEGSTTSTGFRVGLYF